MTGQQLIIELENKGFSLFMSGDRIQYRYTGTGEPDRDRVPQIIEELRKKRDEVKGLLVSQVHPVVPDLSGHETLFRLALDEVAAQDPRGGAIRKIRKDSPETWAEIQTAEDTINELWKQAQGGRPVWPDYCAAVETWKTLFLQAIETEKLLARMGQDGRQKVSYV